MTRRRFIIDFYPCGCSLATGAAVWFRLVGGGVWVGTAVGVPVGAGLEYADEVTLFKALENRNEM